jgi:hypothetical protein
METPVAGTPLRKAAFLLAWISVCWINTVQITLDIVEQKPIPRIAARGVTCLLSILTILLCDIVSLFYLNLLSGLALCTSLASTFLY